MMGVGAKRALGLYRSCAPRQITGRQAVENLTVMAPPAWAEVIGE